jgi:DNA-binding NtrC family response regulator
MESFMPRILIVDDEESICFSMSEYFTLHGYQVDCARERDEAEVLLARDPYEVVIEDLRLGGMRGAEGLEIVELIRRRHPSTRIIVLTAYGSSEMEAEARKRGADAFLRKPKPLADVAQVVYGLIGNQGGGTAPARPPTP